MKNSNKTKTLPRLNMPGVKTNGRPRLERGQLQTLLIDTISVRGPISFHELAKYAVVCGSTTKSASVALPRLVKQGLVRRDEEGRYYLDTKTASPPAPKFGPPKDSDPNGVTVTHHKSTAADSEERVLAQALAHILRSSQERQHRIASLVVDEIISQGPGSSPALRPR